MKTYKPSANTMPTIMNVALLSYTTANVVPDASWDDDKLAEFARDYPGYVESAINAGVIDANIFTDETRQAIHEANHRVLRFPDRPLCPTKDAVFDDEELVIFEANEEPSLLLRIARWFVGANS